MYVRAKKCCCFSGGLQEISWKEIEPSSLSKLDWRLFNATLQQDNARSHVSVDNADVARARRSSRSVLSVTAQPPNSFDLKTLDLGFLRAIQSQQREYQTTPYDPAGALYNSMFRLPIRFFRYDRCRWQYIEPTRC